MLLCAISSRILVLPAPGDKYQVNINSFKLSGVGPKVSNRSHEGIARLLCFELEFTSIDPPYYCQHMVRNLGPNVSAILKACARRRSRASYSRYG